MKEMTDSSEKVNPCRAPQYHAQDFIPRKALEAAFLAKVNDQPKVVCYGVNGSGKKTLLAKYAHEHQGEYPGGIFWVSGKSQETLLKDYLKLADSFNIKIDDRTNLTVVAQAINFYLESGKYLEKFLLVVADVTNYNDIRDFITRFRNKERAQIIVTSQNKAGNTLIECVYVSEFTQEEASKMISNILGEDVTKDDLTLLMNTVGKIPIVLSQVCSSIKKLNISVEAYLQLFNNDEERSVLIEDLVSYWQDAFSIIEKSNPSFAPIFLRVCGYLAPVALPKGLLDAIYELIPTKPNKISYFETRMFFLDYSILESLTGYFDPMLQTVLREKNKGKPLSACEDLIILTKALNKISDVVKPEEKEAFLQHVQTVLAHIENLQRRLPDNARLKTAAADLQTIYRNQSPISVPNRTLKPGGDYRVD